MKKMRSTIVTVSVIISSLAMSLAYARPLLGIDRLFSADYVALIKGKKIAVVANNASVDGQGRSTVALLKHYPHAKVAAIFTPEHGFNVKEDDKVSDDSNASIPIYSLYGPRKSPTAEQLAGVDVIVFDLETVGLRYYTYITTLALVMKAAKEASIPIIVLDRVNPLGGKQVSGAILNKKYWGDFAGYYPIPTRYGLTMGELAQFYNRFFGIEAELTVVPLKNWRRETLFSDTGLTWRAPSPALPTFEQAFLYGIFGPFESLQLAVGRSQTNLEAFRRFGAPWISEKEAKQLVEKLKALKLSGLKFQTISWTPDRAKYENQLCHGFKVSLTALNKIDDIRSFIEVSEVLHAQLRNKLRLSGMDGMLGSAGLRKAIEEQQPATTLISRIKAENREFMKQRESVLLY